MRLYEFTKSVINGISGCDTGVVREHIIDQDRHTSKSLHVPVKLPKQNSLNGQGMVITRSPRSTCKVCKKYTGYKCYTCDVFLCQLDGVQPGGDIDEACFVKYHKLIQEE